MRRHHVGFAVTAALASLIWWQVPSLDSTGESSELSPAYPKLLSVTQLTTDAPAAAGERESVAAATLSIRCLAAEDATALAAVTVRLTTTDGATATGCSDNSGLASLAPCAPGRYLLEARAEGRVSLQGQVVLHAGDNRIALARGGTVAVQVVDADMTPVRDVAVRLLPPLTGAAMFDAEWSTLASSLGADEPLELIDGAWQITNGDQPRDPALPIAPRFQHGLGSWLVKTDANGTATWRGVPLGSGYRWGVCLPRHADVSPPHEHVRLRRVGGGVELGVTPPPNLSGPLIVTAEATARGRAVLVASASVRGHLAEPRAFGSVVRLRRIRETGGDDGVSAIDVEAQTPTTASGEFVFANVRPGTFLVTSSWGEPPATIRFASVACRLAPGQDIDLGAVQPLRGGSLPVNVQLVDERGDAVAPEAAFRSADEAWAQVQLATQPDDRFFHHTLFEAMELPLGHTFVLHGLPRGRVRLHAAPLNVATARGVVELLPSTPLDAHSDSLAAADLRLVVRRGGQVRLTVRGTDGRELDAATIHVRGIDGDERRSLPWLRTGPNAEFTLPAGRYQLVATLDGTGHDNGGSFGSVLCEVRGGDAVDVTLALQPAAGITGRARDATGRILANGSLRFTLPQWANDAAHTWLWSVQTDGDGRFALRGLPPGLALPSDDHQALPALAVGVRHLDWIAR